jgi:radical SAM protein with 4Fe4S-binding SPASM domain
MRKSLIVETSANSCYFRTTVDGNNRKALIQITERCNLHCAHCFVSSGDYGIHMDAADIAGVVVPRLRDARVERVTLTGGEPFAHPDLLAICESVVSAGMAVGVCTNGTLVTPEQVARLAGLGGVHVNVSFDGFRAESHGRFRGNRASFDTTVRATRWLGQAGLLQGLLSTPNVLSAPEEFGDLCSFAAEIGAEYVLMNPLSPFGRGVASQSRLAAPAHLMRAVRAATRRCAGRGVDLVHIRFPNDDALPLGGCDAGRIVYVFANGDTAVCPYLVFAARTPASQHADTEFLVGNILTGDIAPALDGYDFHARYPGGQNATCGSCALSAGCGKGCPAAVVARGERIGALDVDQCPVVDRHPGASPPGPRLLPLLPATRP